MIKAHIVKTYIVEYGDEINKLETDELWELCHDFDEEVIGDGYDTITYNSDALYYGDNGMVEFDGERFKRLIQWVGNKFDGIDDCEEYAEKWSNIIDLDELYTILNKIYNDSEDKDTIRLELY